MISRCNKSLFCLLIIINAQAMENGNTPVNLVQLEELKDNDQKIVELEDPKNIIQEMIQNDGGIIKKKNFITWRKSLATVTVAGVAIGLGALATCSYFNNENENMASQIGDYTAQSQELDIQTKNLQMRYNLLVNISEQLNEDNLLKWCQLLTCWYSHGRCYFTWWPNLDC